MGKTDNLNALWENKDKLNQLIHKINPNQKIIDISGNTQSQLNPKPAPNHAESDME